MHKFVAEPNKNLATKMATLDGKTSNQSFFKESATKRTN
jgi:hypothetical protein